MSKVMDKTYDNDDMDILELQRIFEALTIQDKKPNIRSNTTSNTTSNTKPILLSPKMKNFFENLIERLILRQHIRLYPPKLERENPDDPRNCRCNYCNKHSYLEEIDDPIRYGGVTQKMKNDAIKKRLKRCLRYVKPVSISQNLKNLLDVFCSNHLCQYYYNEHTNVAADKQFTYDSSDNQQQCFLNYNVPFDKKSNFIIESRNEENSSDSEKNDFTFTPIQSDSDDYEESDFEILDNM